MTDVQRVQCDRGAGADGSESFRCILSGTPCRGDWFAVEDERGIRVYDATHQGELGLDLDGTARLGEARYLGSSAAACPTEHRAHSAGDDHHDSPSFYIDSENYLASCGSPEQLGLVPVGEFDFLGEEQLSYPQGALRLDPAGIPIHGEYADADTDRMPQGHPIPGELVFSPGP